MADVKITSLAALTGAATATTDVYVVVDVSVPETKKQTRAEFFKNLPATDIAGAFVFNEAGAALTARFEGDTDINLLVTNGTTDRVGIGTASPTCKLQVSGSFGVGAPVVVTADYTVAATAYYIISNRAATNTLTLPTASTNTGRVLKISNRAAFSVVSASANVTPKDGSAATSAILPATIGAWAELVSNGTTWIIVAAGTIP